MISVLLVDDEQALLDIYRTYLEKSGDLKVTTALSGREGLRWLAKERFDIVVLDDKVETDGFSLLSRVREEVPGIPFILLTRSASEGTAVQAIDYGVDQCVRKRGDPRSDCIELEHKISELIRQKTVEQNQRSTDKPLWVDENGIVAKGDTAALQRRYEELQAAYRELSETDSALREKFRAIMEQQRAVKESEEKYRNLFEAECNAVVLIDDNSGKILEVNNAASVLFGYSGKEFLALKGIELLEESQNESPAAGKTNGKDRVVTIPLQYQKRKDGSIFPAEVIRTHFNWRGHSVSTFLIRDITGRQQAADAQQERIDRAIQYQKALVKLSTTDAPTLRIALNQITETGAAILKADRVGIWFLAPEGQELLCNDIYTLKSRLHSHGGALSQPGNARYFALLQERRAIISRNDGKIQGLSDTVPGQPGAMSKLDIPIRSGKTVIGVLCFEQITAARTWEIEDQDFAMALADYTAIILEQARRRLAEKDYRRSERKYRTVVDRANDGITIIQDGCVRFVNPKAAEIIGSDPRELAGTPFIKWVAPAEKQEVMERYRKRMAGMDIPGIYDTVLIKKDGTSVDVELNAGSMEFDGKLSDLVFIRDITDRKRSEQALLLANQKLNLLSSITRHDILNKLTVVIGYLEMAKMTHDREKLEDFIKKIDDTLQIVEDQVQFTRDYQDMGVKAPEWQDIAATLDSAVSQLDTGRVLVRNQLRGLSLYADPLLEKVLYNIIDNALRYGGNLTEITATYMPGEEEAVVIIEDNGIGIPAGEKGKIFEKGFGHHTGLGLFLAKEILSLTRIDIIETGFPTKGARFEIHIPAGRFRIVGEKIHKNSADRLS